LKEVEKTGLVSHHMWRLQRSRKGVTTVKRLVSLVGIVVLLVAMNVAANAEELVVMAGNWVESDLAKTQLIDEFMKETGIKVRLEGYPHREMLQVIEVQIGGGDTTPDVYWVDSPLTASYAVRGRLAPLGKYFPDAQERWTKAGIAAGSWQGELYSAPFETSTQVMFYNKDLFDLAGIEPPSADPDERWTWGQVVDAAQKIQAVANKDGVTKVWGLLLEQINRPYQLLPLPQSLGGGSGVSADGLKASGYLNNAEWKKAAKWYYDLFNTWKISPKGIGADQVFDQFLAGNAAMIVAGTWDIPKMEADAEFEWGLAAHPYFEEGEPVTPTGSWHLGVNPNTKQMDAAIEFIRFMTCREESIEKRFKSIGQLVPSDVMFQVIKNDSQYEVFPRNVYTMAAYELGNTAMVRPVTPGFLEWEDLVIKMFEDIRNGADPEKTLDQMASRIDRTLAKYR
jgi:ABC-type glycerol-3-phosphate transport system substrate-binding protein